MLWLRRAGTIILTWLALLVWAQPARASDWPLAEVERLRDAVQSLVIELTLETALGAERVSELRGELQEIYRDLDALADDLRAPTARDGEARPGGWLEYTDVELFVDPPGARFTGWQPGVKIDFEWGDYGEIIVGVIKNGYTAKCWIRRAYHGDVSASLESHPSGELVLAIEDDLGSHEFLIERGGLGPVFLRGREGYRPPRLSSEPLPDPYLTWARWYDPYRDLVHAGQLAESPGTEWLIAQYEAGEYASPELADLGERLELLGPADETPLGWLSYELAGQLREVEIPDPRHQPEEFVDTIDRLQRCVELDQYFRLSIRW